MTDPTPATVAVPVTLIHRAAVALAGQADDGARADLLALLPKPTARLVVVDLEDGHDRWYKTDLEAQPDLLTLLDDAVDKWFDSGEGYRDEFKSRMRNALGVNA